MFVVHTDPALSPISYIGRPGPSDAYPPARSLVADPPVSTSYRTRKGRLHTFAGVVLASAAARLHAVSATHSPSTAGAASR